MFKKTKMVLAGTTMVGATCVGCYYYGQFTAAEQRLQELEASNKAQAEYLEQLKAQDIRHEKFINAISNETELVLFTEEGITNTVIEKGKNFLTHTETQFAIEYRVKLSIKTSDISYYDGEDRINVVINRDDIEVSSLEILNKNIINNNKKLFGRYMTQDEKDATEKLITEKAKEDALNNKTNINIAIDGFTDYMKDLAEVMGVKVDVIIH